MKVNKRLVLAISISLLVLTSCRPITPETENRVDSEISIGEAYSIALESSCVSESGSEVFEKGYYNSSTKTWWLDTSLSKEGCNPKCVVSESEKTAEINWMCTGLIPKI